MQPSIVIVTEYIPVAAAVAFAIDGLRTAEVKLFGPVQLYTAPGTSVTSSCSVPPWQIGPLFVAVTDMLWQPTLVFAVPVIEPLNVSVAVIDCAPPVFRVNSFVKVCV